MTAKSFALQVAVSVAAILLAQYLAPKFGIKA